MLKLYDWTGLFLETIHQKRTDELVVSYKRTWVAIAMMSVMNFWPMFLQSACIVICIGFGFTIEIETMFTVITLFGVMRMPIMMLPWFLGQVIQFNVSMKRLQRFLLCQEL
jgi:hypothetical protein